MRNALARLQVSWLAGGAGKLGVVLGLAMVAALVSTAPFAASAQSVDTTFLSGQFWSIFQLARTAVFAMAIIFAIYAGIKAVQGDSGGWLKMAAGLLVAFIAFNPEWLPNAVFGATIDIPYDFNQYP